ncbi:hypothetical protein, partial [uncultured Mailhella sp.]|uniref:hypothetical protein n=1 Tax=uncultured Mailhella sp. TaxID=1981031 RepID=UPI0026077BB4
QRQRHRGGQDEGKDSLHVFSVPFCRMGSVPLHFTTCNFQKQEKETISGDFFLEKEKSPASVRLVKEAERFPFLTAGLKRCAPWRPGAICKEGWHSGRKNVNT